MTAVSSLMALPSAVGFPNWRPIGVGGFGSVYAARRSGDGVEVAVKIAHRVDDPRFVRELRALELVPHGTAPALLGHTRTPDGRPVLVLELLHGQTLAAWLARAPRPTHAESLARFELACAGVAALHRTGFVHRDLKPSNLFCCHDGSVRVIDLGLARAVEDSDAPNEHAVDVTGSNRRVGTAAYMAPEQCAGGIVDHRADVYALGVILFEILCGRPPFVGDAASVVQAHVARRPWPPSTIDARPEVARLDDVVLRCLAKDPADRFGGPLELVEAIRTAVAVTAAPVAEAVGRRRIALLCVASTAPRTELAAIVSSCGGEVARVHGDYHVIGFAGAASTRRGVADALRAAARLGERARAARIHVDDVNVRLHASTAMMLGSAIDQPHAWPPASVAWDGVALTEAAAAAIRFAERAPQSPPPAAEPVLHGRDATITALEASARSALRARQPRLSWLTGATGTGKTRIARELIGRLDAAVLVLAARDPATGPEASRSVLRAVLDLPAALRERDIVAACRRLGALDVDRTVTALGYALGVISASSAQVRELLEAPGAARGAIARAVAATLRSRAAHASLVVIADDAHWLDPAIVDGIVHAVRDAGAALWVLATTPNDAGIRSMADIAERHELGPLDADASRALLLDLLRPAEYVPAGLLEPLLATGQGIPLYLAEAAATLRAAGAIRTSNAGAWHVASEGLEQFGTSPLFEQLAERHLEALPGDLAAFARMCAVLGDDLDISTIDAIQRVLERDGDRGGAAAARALAPAVGIDRLLRAGLLLGDAAGVRFRHPLLREAVERVAPAAERLAIHRAARRHHGDRTDPDARASFARHAAACGDTARAATLYLELADEARRDHGYVLAERLYGAALEHATDDAIRGAALAGRGKVRYRIQRMDEALADLDAARVIAVAAGREVACAALLLEAATVLDWSSRHDEARERASEAFSIVERIGECRLAARCALARGRDAFRSERWSEAIGHLDQVKRDPDCDHETRVVAELIGGMCLVAVGALDDAARTFDSAIAACERRGDLLHLAVAYTNRMWLWSAHGAVSNAVGDLARAARLAREIGQARIERAAEHNLAELLLWRGDFDAALPRAQRALELQLRHVELLGPEDALLVARIAVARGDDDHTRHVLNELEARCPPESWSPTSSLLGEMVHLALDGGDSAAWDELVERARDVLLPEEQAELAAVMRRAVEKGE